MNDRNRMTIMRGLPGSGKSTTARSLGGVVLSSDDYFMVGGIYRFDVARLGLAHEWNQDRARKACEAGEPHVVIDNTNTRRWEMEAYKSIARRNGYDVREHTVEVWDVVLCHQRGTHGVPLDTIAAMKSRFER